MSLRVIAIDWSGNRNPREAAKKIFLADFRHGHPLRLESGLDRSAVENRLCAIAEEDPNVIIGLDFGFSFPDWYFAERGLADAAELWALAEAEGEHWLEECRLPFWGRAPGHRTRPDLPDPFRRTEREVRQWLRTRGLDGGPTSVFQLVGPSQVGAGSVRGLPMLARLSRRGFHIWPMQSAGWPLVIEIYPRACLREKIRKTSKKARGSYFRAHHLQLPDDVRGKALASDDAFDALTAAFAMAKHADRLSRLPAIADPQLRREGLIWVPDDNFPSFEASPAG